MWGTNQKRGPSFSWLMVTRLLVARVRHSADGCDPNSESTAKGATASFPKPPRPCDEWTSYARCGVRSRNPAPPSVSLFAPYDRRATCREARLSSAHGSLVYALGLIVRCAI